MYMFILIMITIMITIFSYFYIQPKEINEICKYEICKYEYKYIFTYLINFFWLNIKITKDGINIYIYNCG